MDEIWHGLTQLEWILNYIRPMNGQSSCQLGEASKSEAVGRCDEYGRKHRVGRTSWMGKSPWWGVKTMGILVIIEFYLQIETICQFPPKSYG